MLLRCPTSRGKTDRQGAATSSGATTPIRSSRGTPHRPRTAFLTARSCRSGTVTRRGVFRCDDRARRMDIHAGFSSDGVNWRINPHTIDFVCDDPAARQAGIPLRPARLLDRGPLLRVLVQRLSRPDHRPGLHPRFRDLPPARKCVPALQPQRRPVPAADRRALRHAQPAQRQRAYALRRYVLQREPGSVLLGPPSLRDGADRRLAEHQSRPRPDADRDQRRLAALLPRRSRRRATALCTASALRCWTWISRGR